MRFLPAGPDHELRGASESEPESQRRTDRQRDARQHLPLRYLSTNPRSDPQTGRELGMKATIFQVTRRDFLRQTGVGAGALVLGCAISPEASGLDLPSFRELIHGI